MIHQLEHTVAQAEPKVKGGAGRGVFYRELYSRPAAPAAKTRVPLKGEPDYGCVDWFMYDENERAGVTEQEKAGDPRPGNMH